MSTTEPVDIQLRCSLLVRSDCEKMFGVKIDYKLNFDEHVKTLCGKANNKTESVNESNSIYECSKEENANELIFHCTVELLHTYMDVTLS